MPATLHAKLTALHSRLTTPDPSVSGTLVLDSGKYDSAGTALYNLVKKELGVPSITITGGDIAVNTDAAAQTVTVSGGHSTDEILGIIVPTLTLVFGISKGDLTLHMTIEADTSWSLNRAFPNLVTQTEFKSINIVNTTSQPAKFILKSQPERDAHGRMLTPAGLSLDAHMTLSNDQVTGLAQLITGTPSTVPVTGRASVANSDELL